MCDAACSMIFRCEDLIIAITFPSNSLSENDDNGTASWRQSEGPFTEHPIRVNYDCDVWP